MLSKQPERRMRAVRSCLLVAWFVLIASLLYDPLTPVLTRPENLWSPFHVGQTTATVQGTALPAEPYAMGGRIFWTMILPLVPLFLMLFGHETWRRVCPLSHFSQIPRMLGWQRQIRKLNRRSGSVEGSLALLPMNGWMRRNHLTFQFAFLSIGLVGRILFYNADRLALALLFCFMLLFSATIGLLYGGKTWCNYFCPIGVVQYIYTGPGGLFDSKAVNSSSAITQSMCRTATALGDKSNCVGCTSNCADIDVEHSYWKGVDSHAKRRMYYAYFGLVFAFYTYYYVYSGGWSYYFSGAWTHEAGQLGQLFSPGFYLAGHAFPIPKLIAAPLYFAACIFASYWLFRGAEWCYARLSMRGGKPLGRDQLRHRMMTVAAFLSFNLFYVFAGRPNLLLMPTWLIRLIDAVLILISTTWLWRSLERDADVYRRESLAKSLRDQLRRMGFRSEELLEGRSLASLSADEVYVLARTLPGFSTAQKREAYRAILAEVLETGETRSAESLELLADLRSQLGLSDADHAAITDALGIDDPLLLDPSQARSVEGRIRVNNYRDYLYGVLEQEVSAGMKPRLALTNERAFAASEPFRTLYGISIENHEKIVDELTHDGSKFAESATKLVAAICTMEAQRFSLSFDIRPEARLVRHALLLRQRSLLRDTANLIASIEDPKIARSLAQSVYALMDKEAVSAVSDAAAGMPEATLRAFMERTSDPAPFSYLDVVAGDRSPDEVLLEMTGDKDPLVAALSGSALGHAGADRSENTETMAAMLSVAAFSKLELATLADIAGRSHRATFSPGEAICQYGEVSDRMFVLVSGETRAWIETDGREVTLGVGRPGDVFGELGVITGRPRSASIVAAGAAPATVIAIPREVIEQLLSHDLTAARGILEVVSGYLLNTLAATQHHAPAPAALPG